MYKLKTLDVRYINTVLVRTYENDGIWNNCLYRFVTDNQGQMSNKGFLCQKVKWMSLALIRVLCNVLHSSRIVA